MTFGEIKSIIEKNLLESYSNPANFKKTLREFKHNILENKAYSKLYSLYDDLSTPKNLSSEYAEEYLEEGISLIRYILENVKLPKKGGNVENLYKDLDILVYLDSINIQERVQSKKNVLGVLMSKPKINENLKSQLLVLPTLVYETYGMTETITHVAAKNITDNYFSVLPNVTISTDSRNCLVIDVPRISNYSIVTNDVVKIIGNSEFELLGRFDNVINSGGVKLFPEQIELKLAHKIQTRFFVTGIPDDQFGEIVALIVEGSPIPFEDEIFNDLLPYEKPKKIHFLSNFLETESGKIKRAATLNLV